MRLDQLYVSTLYGCFVIALSLKLGLHQVGLVPITLSILTSLGVFALLDLYALLETYYEVLWDMFRWFNSVFIVSLPVPVQDVFQ